MPQTVRIAGVQMDVQIGQTKHNLSRMLEFLSQTARGGDEAALMVHIAAALELAHGHGQ